MLYLIASSCQCAIAQYVGVDRGVDDKRAVIGDIGMSIGQGLVGLGGPDSIPLGGVWSQIFLCLLLSQ